jgi:DNA-binding NarL/FixJ family response regulator
VARKATLPVAESSEEVAQAVAAHEVVTKRRPMSSNPHLSPRERDVLAFLTVGMTNRKIAWELNVSVSTVKSHLSSIYMKLGVSNRTEAALVGVRIYPLLRR